MLWLKDPKTGEKSVTLTLLIAGFLACLAKLILSGNVVGGLSFGVFSGGDFAAAIGSLGGVYAWRKSTDKATE